MSWENYSSFESSNVALLRYEGSTMTLEVTFKNGGVYHYYDVPSREWSDFKAAESKGRFLHTNIKGVYRYSKM